MGQAGMSLTWDVVLKPVAAGDDDNAKFLIESAQAARDGNAESVRASLQQLPADADAEYLAGAGRVAIVARDFVLARSLFARAIERDRMSYRATLGLASTFLFDRDFDSASRAFDAARNRTKDKEEQRFISAAIGDLATIKVR
jgi:thioredoxin-like negative regulator of GroEL